MTCGLQPGTWGPCASGEGAEQEPDDDDDVTHPRPAVGLGFPFHEMGPWEVDDRTHQGPQPRPRAHRVQVQLGGGVALPRPVSALLSAAPKVGVAALVSGRNRWP